MVTQPSFLYSTGQRYQEGVLPHQTSWLWPIGSFQHRGVKVAFSSDSPLVTSNPLAGIYAAVARKTETGQKLDIQSGTDIWEPSEHRAWTAAIELLSMDHRVVEFFKWIDDGTYASE